MLFSQDIVQRVFRKCGALFFVPLSFLIYSNVYALVDINHATVTEFDSLPNVTYNTALDIVGYRELFGFTAVSDIQNVTSVDLLLFQTIEPYLTITSTCPAGTPETIQIGPVSDLNYLDAVNKTIAFGLCIYEQTSFVLNTDNTYDQGDCFNLTFTKTLSTSDAIDTVLNTFDCTVFVEPPPPVPQPTNFDGLANETFQTPEWGAATDVVYSWTTGFGQILSVTAPQCFDNYGTPILDTAASWTVYWEQERINFGNLNPSQYRALGPLNATTTQIGRTDIRLDASFDYDFYSYDNTTQTYSFLERRTKSYNKYLKTIYVGDSTCFLNADSTTTPPLNVADTNFLSYVETNDLANDLVKFRGEQQAREQSIVDNTKSTKFSSESSALSLGSIDAKLNNLQTIDNSLSDINATLQNQQVPELQTPNWTPFGVEAQYSDLSLDLINAKANFSNSITGIQNVIATAITPSFPLAVAQACDNGVNVHGINISICWTEHIGLLAKMGLAILAIASFWAIRIILIG